MTTTTKTAKKLYEVFANNHDDDVIQDYKTKLNICTDENRISVWMTVNRKTLKSAYSYFHKALEQAVADGALDAKIAQFGEFADDADCIDFGGKDSITAFDNIDSSFAYGIDDNTCCDLGYYFWFWVKTNETAAEDNVEVIAETDTAQVKNNDTAHVEETATDINEAEFKFEVGKTYYGVDFLGDVWNNWNENIAIKIRTLKVIKRTAKTITAITKNGEQVTKKISICYHGTTEIVGLMSDKETSGDGVQVTAKKEYTDDIAAAPTDKGFGAWKAATEAAHVEYKPQTDWENPHDFATVGNLNGQPRQYVNPESIAAPKGFWADRINGNYITNINGEFVRFINHSIVEISAGKSGYSYERRNGRKNFYRYGRKIAAAKIAEVYMNGEIAAEQNKVHHEFFDAHKTAYNKFFQAYFKVTTADGNVHNFERTFDSFDDAKALVDKFTATFSEPADILIKRNGRLAPVYYTRTDGLPGTYTMFYFGEDGFDPEVFSLLPALDTLNDVDDDEPALVDCAYEFDAEDNVREFKIGDAETGDVISFQGSRLFKITSTKHDARLYRDEDGTLHFDIKCYDGSPQLTMHDVTPDEFFAYVEVHDTTREEIARLPLVELKRKHARVFEESLRLGEYLFCSEDRTAYDKAHARLMQLICNGCADTAERWRLEEENAPRRKRIVDAEIKYSCLQYKIGKYAEEIDAREKAAVRAQEPRESVSNVEDNILLDPAKIVSETPEASTKIKKLFSRRKNHERKKTARHIQHRPRRMVHAARRH